jgi:hypothetical protein
MNEKGLTDEGPAPRATEAGGVGDVETAGETTAADTISGPADTRPVGADTTADVAGDAKPTRHGGD